VVKLLYSPIFELIEVKRAAKYILTRLITKLVAITLLNYKCIKIRQEMNKVSSYHDYEKLGMILDKLQGKDIWKLEKESHLYDWQRIESRLENMKYLREKKDIKGLVDCLRQDLVKNIGGICNQQLYNISKIGTKQLIEDYHNEVIKCIQFIYYYQGRKIDLQKKIEFFSDTRHSYGRTALFLSGGAHFGKYHFGVLKALYE